VNVVLGPVTQVVLSKRGVPPRMPDCAAAKEKSASISSTTIVSIVAGVKMTSQVGRKRAEVFS
jgi:hypothetical protein